MKVALVVATHNGGKVIKKCIESLLKTDYEDKEIIAVDDGSTDNTTQILESFGNKIKVLKGKRGGVGAARNIALNNADAEFVATTDDDCVVESDWIKEAIKYFSDQNVAAVTGEKIYRITNLISAVRSMEYHIRFLRRGPTANSVECPVAIFRKEALLKIGGFLQWSKVGGEDTEIGYKLKEAGYKIVYEPKMVVYHDPEDSLRLYLRRNFRNGVAHVRVFWERNKRVALSDDFFPLTLRIQPFLTILFFLFAILILKSYLFILPFLLCLFFILFNFLPIVFAVIQRKGILSLFATMAILFLRNIVWVWGLVIGTLRLWKR